MRIRLVNVVILLLAGFSAGQVAGSPSRVDSHPAAKAQTNWSQFHFTAGGTRLNPYEKTLNVKNVGRLRPKWHHHTTLLAESSPAVVDGVVYVGCGLDVCALKATTGVKLWSFTTGSGVESSPAVANGVVYAGSNDGNLYALDAVHNAHYFRGFCCPPPYARF